MRFIVQIALFCSLGLPSTMWAQSGFQLKQQVLPNPENEPAPVHPVPHPRQLKWQETEFYAFFHYGMNTYTGKEWGNGDEKESIFAPTKVPDPEQWLTAAKEAGMRGGIAVIKHHDGFCLWPTATTAHNVTSSTGTNARQTNIPRDFAVAARKLGMKYGFYISPWDRNSALYGTDKYVKDVFLRQCLEAAQYGNDQFEMWFDGANGGNGWYGGADSTRQIDPKSYYRYEDASKMLRKNNKDIMIFGGTVPTIRWIGNEQGWAGETNWAMYDEDKAKHYSEAQWGMEDAKQWLPGEVDVSIRPGWFYHPREDHQVRSVANLVRLYYQSVGRNANLLLNCPIDLHGRIPAEDSTRLIAWHDHLKEAFRDNKLRGVAVTASNLRSGDKKFAPNLSNDGKTKTYWAMADGVTSGYLFYRFSRPTRLNTLVLQEYIALGQRVKRFRIETETSPGVFEPVATSDSLTTIGYKRIIRFAPVETKSLRVTFEEARGPVCIAEIAAYLTPEVLEAPKIRRDESDKVHITSVTPDVVIEYAIEDAKTKYPKGWQRYKGPFTLSDDHATIRARVSTSTNKDRPETTKRLGFAASQIQTPSLGADDRKALLDGNGYTTVTLEAGQTSLELLFEDARPIQKLIYTPSQQRDASGHVRSYSIYVDGQKVASGNFDNIQNNPIPQEVLLPAGTSGSRIRFVAEAIVGQGGRVTLGDLSIE